MDKMVAKPVRKCSVEGCDGKYRSLGFCIKHYARFRTHGDPLVTKHVFGDPKASFWAKVAKSDGCWEWTASRNQFGYGTFFYEGRKQGAHRIAYRLDIGDIPEGKHLDHLCRNRGCVNPAHLRPVTSKENREHLDSVSPANKTSGVRGVYRMPASGKWRVSVTHNYRQVHVGYFTSLAEAEAAAIAKRNELFTHNDKDRED